MNAARAIGWSYVGGRRLRATSARLADLPPVNIAVTELVPDSSAALCGQLSLRRPLLYPSGTAMKHPVLDRVKPSFVIFDIRAL